MAGSASGWLTRLVLAADIPTPPVGKLHVFGEISDEDIKYKKSDGTVVSLGGVTSFNGRSGAVVPIQADYDSFFLTPAEGNAVYQPLDATLTALAAANWAANAFPIGTGADALSQTVFAANTFPARASSGNLVAKTITDFGLSLVDDADATAARATLGVTATGGDTTYLFRANNLSDVASASTSRTNLGLVAIASSGSASDLTSGILPAGRFPALTDDVTTSAGSLSTTIAVGAVTDTKASLANKPTVGLVATSNLVLSAAQTIDGVLGAAGTTYVLATGQTAGAENGPWIMQAGAWTRPTWYPSGGATQAFQFIATEARLGTLYGGTLWRMTTAGAITIDTTATTWTEVARTINNTSVSNGVTGTGAVVLATTPTLVTPVIGAATGTSLSLSSSGVALNLTNSTGRALFGGATDDTATTVQVNGNSLVQLLGGAALTSTIIGEGSTILDVYRYSADSSSAVIRYNKSRGTKASNASVTAGDGLGANTWRGYDGTQFTAAVQLIPATEGTISSGVLPGRIGIHTANSSGTLTEAMRLDSSQRVIVNGASQGTKAVGGVNAQLQVFSGSAPISALRGSADTTGAVIRMAKSRNTAYGSFTAITTGDEVGRVEFNADDGTNYATIAGQIKLTSTGTIATGQVPGIMTFVTANSAGTLTTGLTIDSAQLLTVAVKLASPQINIAGNVSQAAWTTAGVGFNTTAATYTDTTSSGTVASVGVHSFAIPVLAASSSTTFTAAATLMIVGAPTAGSNVTLTNTRALDVTGLFIMRSGGTIQGGSCSITGSTNINANNNATTNIGTGTTTSAVSIGGSANAVNISATAGGTLGFFAVAATTRASAYTQTYSTATKTQANLGSAALTDNSGGTSGNPTIASIAAAGVDTTAAGLASTRNAVATLAAQVNLHQTDLANIKQVLNSVIDDLQAYGLFQ